MRTLRLAATIALVAATGCTGSHGSRSASRPPPTTSALTTSPTPSPTGVPTSSVSAASTVLVGSLSLALPSGWKAEPDGNFGHVCMDPPHAVRRVMGCGGLDIYYAWNGFAPGNELGNFITDGAGWYHATDVQPCPVAPTAGPDGLNGIRPGALLEHRLAPVGDRRADYYRWAARCDNGFRFTPRAWYLPVSKVVVFDYLDNPESSRLLSKAAFDEGRWSMAYLHGTHAEAGSRTVDVDEIRWLSGAEANRYAKAHGMESPVPNDYLIVDDDTRTVPMPLSEQAVILSDFSLAHAEPGHVKNVSMARFVEFLTGKANWLTPFHLHLTNGGVIDRVQEQYRP